MYSPGAPSLGHEIERRFWQQIATGITSEKAAQAVGASQAVGSLWFRYRSDMPLFMSKPIAGRYLSFAEREEIALLSVQGFGVREIARRIGRSASTVSSRELTRNAATRNGCLEYRASVAQWKAERFAKRPARSCNCCFHSVVWFGYTSNNCAGSASVRSATTAANTVFA
jgi:hypothetical protein